MGGGKWLVYADGASRGNPGEASIGAVVYSPEGAEAATVSQRIGHATNNEAEYQAAIAGLQAGLELGADDVELLMDSELVVRHLLGVYRVRNERLRPYFERLMALKGRFRVFSIQAVPRANNKRADKLANLALDSPAG